MTMKYFIYPRYKKLPINLKKIFPERNQFFLEIGFGNGDFLIEKALSNPKAAFIGIELSLTSVTKLLKKIKELNTDNIAVIMCDAKFAVREFFDENLDGIFVNFPCPWPKKRHSQRRLNDISFVVGLLSALNKEGFISVYSDHFNYINRFKDSIEEFDCFTNINLKTNPPMINTKYEKKWRNQKKNIFHLSAIKNLNKAVSKIAGGEEMPHVHLEEFSSDRLKDVLDKTFEEGEIFFKYIELFQSFNDNKYLLQTITVDDDFEQRFFIIIRKRSNDKWLISLDSYGLPFRTPSVKKAVYYLGEMQK
ncbi:MAG: tRNA (guanosine(46)-N7)-methyltransferase TrmB [Kosmotogaceae bacterium]